MTKALLPDIQGSKCSEGRKWASALKCTYNNHGFRRRIGQCPRTLAVTFDLGRLHCPYSSKTVHVNPPELDVSPSNPQALKSLALCCHCSTVFARQHRQRDNFDDNFLVASILRIACDRAACRLSYDNLIYDGFRFDPFTVDCIAARGRYSIPHLHNFPATDIEAARLRRTP
jgi:hypothetical protein